MQYVSISRSFRGFNFQTDWKDAELWKNEMQRQYSAENEIEWSVLIDINGNPVMRYGRGIFIKTLRTVSED